jgi:hypothetical protein
MRPDMAGVVPQQPPTTLRDRLGELADERRHRLRALVIEAELVRQPGIRDRRRPSVSATRLISANWARISRAPSAQLSPTVIGLGVPDGVPEGVGVWPDRRAADRSVMVPEIMIGSVRARFDEDAPGRPRSRLAFSVSKIVSIEDQVGAALEQTAHLLLVGVAHLVEGDGPESPGSLTSGEQRQRCGSSARARPATKRRRPFLDLREVRRLPGKRAPSTFKSWTGTLQP